ncbi:hypothetical protein H2203_008276 [Taxawa tesnikishii (nom. ined.)]|nr:hypothetical protein H2203_008276 [Dothideales sp. JES 119]
MDVLGAGVRYSRMTDWDHSGDAVQRVSLVHELVTKTTPVYSHVGKRSTYRRRPAKNTEDDGFGIITGDAELRDEDTEDETDDEAEDEEDDEAEDEEEDAEDEEEEPEDDA